MSQSTKVLSGSEVAKEIKSEVEQEVSALRNKGVTPKLVVVLAGSDPASKIYVGNKARTSAKLGMESETIELPEDVTQDRLEATVDHLNDDPAVDGILVQLPLPGQIDASAILDRIDPLKDVDGFHPANVGLLLQGRPRLSPCTPGGIMELLRRRGVELKGRNAVVVGRSDIVGKPMAALLLHQHATVTVCHSRTAELAEHTRRADILIAAAGKRGLISAEHVSEGAIVVDVGIHRVTDRSEVEHLYPGNQKRLATFERRGAVLAGDVDFARVEPLASMITPVPGGVGPLTIAMLMANTARAARLRRHL